VVVGKTAKYIGLECKKGKGDLAVLFIFQAPIFAWHQSLHPEDGGSKIL
jgi:hypothetical protein